MIKKISIESPFAARAKELQQERLALALGGIRYALSRGHAPFASHLLYTAALDDRDPDQRDRGIEAGLAISTSCDEQWILTDLGLSRGMLIASERWPVTRPSCAFRLEDVYDWHGLLDTEYDRIEALRLALYRGEAG